MLFGPINCGGVQVLILLSAGGWIPPGAIAPLSVVMELQGLHFHSYTSKG